MRALLRSRSIDTASPSPGIACERTRASAITRFSGIGSLRDERTPESQGVNVPRRVIDLSQPLSRTTQVHPFFTTPRIVRELIHVDYAEDQPSFNAELII